MKRAIFNLVPEILLILMIGTGAGCDDDKGRTIFLHPKPSVPPQPSITFREMHPQFKPQGRTTVLVHDPDFNVTRLIGGDDGWVTQYQDTWEWDGINWRRGPDLPPGSHGDGKRAMHGAAFDSIRGVTVVFGGYDADGNYSLKRTFDRRDTVEGRFVHWYERFTPITPPGRMGHALTYQPNHGTTLLFGGMDADFTTVLYPVMRDTWTYDGVTWIPHVVAASPPSRAFHAMAYDSDRHVTVLFGGVNGMWQHLADTWEFDGVTWKPIITGTAPPPRAGHGMVYDESRKKIVLLEGADSTSVFTDVWEYDGITWTDVTPTVRPPARYLHGVAYDKLRKTTVIYGGLDEQDQPLNDTWEYGQ